MNPFTLPLEYYKKEGLSTSSIAYTGALLAAIGGIINLPHAGGNQRAESNRPIMQRTLFVDFCLIMGGFYAANIFLRNAGLLKKYSVFQQ